MSFVNTVLCPCVLIFRWLPLVVVVTFFLSIREVYMDMLFVAQLQEGGCFLVIFYVILMPLYAFCL